MLPDNKEQPIVSQQQMHFDETNQGRPTSYAAGYEEAPYHMDSFGQKLSGQEVKRGPSPAQRLTLAIVSILALMLMLFAIVGVVAFAHIATPLAPVLGISSMLFFVAIIVINIVFNRKR